MATGDRHGSLKLFVGGAPDSHVHTCLHAVAVALPSILFIVAFSMPSVPFSIFAIVPFMKSPNVTARARTRELTGGSCMCG